MDNRSENSRTSSRHSKSVVFPRINKNGSLKSQRENDWDSLDDQVGERQASMRSKSHREDQGRSKDFNRYVLERLEFTEQVLEDERRARSLLEDHLRTVLVNVQRLSKDVAMLQHQVKSAGDNVHSQGIAVKNLELHQVAGIGDIWNRLTLTDLNSIKLSGDLNKLAGEVSDLKRCEEDVNRRLNKLNSAVDSLVTRLEKVNLEFEKNLEVLKVKLDAQNQSIEDKLKGVENSYKTKRSPDIDHKLEEHCMEIVGNLQQRLDTSLKTQKTWQESFEGKVAKLEERLFELMKVKSRKEEDMVGRIKELSVNQQMVFQRSQEQLKNSYREAFLAVYESITTMQTVLETKLKMTEADLKTSINSIMRTISHS